MSPQLPLPVPASGTQPPQPGVDYSRVLAGPDASPLRSMAGILLALGGYVFVVPIASQLLVGLDWTLQGRPGSFTEYLKEAIAFLHPGGLAATNLALGLLTVVSLLLVRYWNHRRTRWACSVQPGMRWRYLLLCLLVASVVLNAVLWLGRGHSSFVLAPQAQVWLWLAIVLVTSPLQAAAEEFFFRGYLLQSFGSMVHDQKVGRWFAVVASALVFALFHGVQNPALFVDRFGFGLMAGVLVLATGGLEAPIACHVANNIFAFTWAALGGGIAQARALQAISWGNAASDLLGFGLFALAAWWLARRMQLADRTPAA